MAVAGDACADRDSRYIEQSAKEEPSAAAQEEVEVGRRSRTTAGLGCTPYREVAGGVAADSEGRVCWSQPIIERGT